MIICCWNFICILKASYIFSVFYGTSHYENTHKGKQLYLIVIKISSLWWKTLAYTPPRWVERSIRVRKVGVRIHDRIRSKTEKLTPVASLVSVHHLRSV